MPFPLRLHVVDPYAGSLSEHVHVWCFVSKRLFRGYPPWLSVGLSSDTVVETSHHIGDDDDELQIQIETIVPLQVGGLS